MYERISYMTVAKIELLYSNKGDNNRQSCSISISQPILIENDLEHIPNTVGCYYCRVKIEPVEKLSFLVYGANAMQAVHIASDIEFILKNINKNHDFFYMDGVPYIFS